LIIRYLISPSFTVMVNSHKSYRIAIDDYNIRKTFSKSKVLCCKGAGIVSLSKLTETRRNLG
ncbi:hypothetical protein QUA20_31595, partial [Microcoleus sp. Pol7_A1]|uniref:hypothetical protein n=1 Tax=Microcoleus sp. Pol7_A1 TaxID=2818893 RepID=UPI002FD1C724